MSARSIRRGSAGGRRHQYRQGNEIDTPLTELETVTLPATGCCFCLDPERTWEYPADDAVLTGGVIRGPWYACNTCAKFINAEDQSNLITRMTIRRIANIFHGRRANSMMNAIARATSEMAANIFLQARYGEPRKV